MSPVILYVENERIPIASKDNSKPSNGREDNTAALIPKTESKPTPHAIHPGAKIPRKIPVVPKKPNVFPELDFIIFVLYKIRLNNIPKRTLINKRLMKEWRNIVSLNPIKKLGNNFIIPINPN